MKYFIERKHRWVLLDREKDILLRAGWHGVMTFPTRAPARAVARVYRKAGKSISVIKVVIKYEIQE